MNRKLNEPIEISVIISTCDRPYYLKRALKYIAKQGVRFQLIIADDSKHAIKDFNKKIISSYDCTYVDSGTYKGASNTRNRGSEKAYGKYIAFLDDDDYWMPYYLLRVHAFAIKNNLDLVLTWFCKNLNGSYIVEKKPKRDMQKNDFLINNPGLRGSNMYIKKTIYDEIGGFDEELLSSNDKDFGYRLFQQHIKYLPYEKPLVVFNDHKGNRLSSLNSRAKVLGISKFFSKYYSKMTEVERIKFIAKSKKLWNVNLEH